MQITYDQETNTVALRAAGSAVQECWKARGQVDLKLKFTSGGVAARLAVDAPIQLGIKNMAAGGWLLASVDTWTRPGTDSGWYTATLDLHTEEIVALLEDADAEEQTTWPVYLEVRWGPPGVDPTPWRISQTVPVELVRPVLDEEDGTPANASEPSVYLRTDAAQDFTDTARMQGLANLGIRITDGGYLEIDDGDGNTFHAMLNSGAAPE